MYYMQRSEPGVVIVDYLRDTSVEKPTCTSWKRENSSINTHITLGWLRGLVLPAPSAANARSSAYV